jgi:hypothetical protein
MKIIFDPLESTATCVTFWFENENVTTVVPVELPLGMYKTRLFEKSATYRLFDESSARPRGLFSVLDVDPEVPGVPNIVVTTAVEVTFRIV